MGKKNLELFDFLEANYIPAIKASGEDKDLNEVLFKTVDYLLRHTYELSSNTLSAYSEREKRKIFSSFGKVAQTACEFYQASKEHLDPVALNGEIGQKLETATQKVTEVNASLESIERTEADLLKKEKELNQINEKYEKITEKVSTLKKIKETVSNDVLKNLESEAAELERTNKQNQKIKSELESQIKELENTHQSLSKSVAKANANKKEIEENIIDTINAKHDTVREIYAKYSKNLDSTKAEIENFKRQYSLLDDELIKAQSEYDLYNFHLGENSKIVVKLKEYGISRIDDFSTEMDNLKKHVKSELVRFDNIIKVVIEELEKQKEDIGRRNKTLL